VNASAKAIVENNDIIEKSKTDEITAINDLIEHAKTLDGQEVIVQGEAIGERMDRGDYSWVNINDGTNAIGIWLKKSEAEKIATYGNYKNIGDTIQVAGVFYRACNDHGGEADLHAISISIVKKGYTVNKQVEDKKIVAAIVLCIIALVLVLVRFKVISSKKFLNEEVQESQD
jgi:hypothetical protein